MSDTDLAPRLTELLPQVVKTICEMTAQVSYPTYFEFMVEFVKFYACVLDPHILQLLSTVINRVMYENELHTKQPSGTTH